MIRDFSKFLNEEITIKGNTGVPGEEDRSEPSYLRGVERKGQEEVSDVRNPHPLLMEIMQLANRAKTLSVGKETELEEFAEKILREIYPSTLSNVVLDIKLVKDGNEVNDFLRDENEKKIKKQEEESQEEEEEQSQEEEEPSIIPSTDRDLKLEVDKRKLANAIIQGEAKNTKNIIEMPDCRDGLKRILGDAKGQELHTTLLRITKIANKLDWVIPVNVKADMMQNAPQGMAGAVSTDWECKGGKCKKKSEDILKKIEDGDDLDDMDEEVGDALSDSDTKPTIKVRAVDFSMLLHETVKGIYALLSRAGLPQDIELAKNVALNTSSFADEAEDFRYGPYIAADLRDFVNKNPNIDKYPNLREEVYTRLIVMPADEFLSAMKNILLESPEGRKIIDDLLTTIISELDEYEEQMRKFNSEEALGETDDKIEGEDEQGEDVPEWWKEGEESDIDKLVKKSSEKEPSELSQREVQELVDDALDREDYAEVKRLSQFLKEGREIYLKEIERINEKHTRRNK